MSCTSTSETCSTWNTLGQRSKRLRKLKAVMPRQLGNSKYSLPHLGREIRRGSKVNLMRSSGKNDSANGQIPSPRVSVRCNTRDVVDLLLHQGRRRSLSISPSLAWSTSLAWQNMPRPCLSLPLSEFCYALCRSVSAHQTLYPKAAGDTPSRTDSGT